MTNENSLKPLRLSKLMSERDICSRREADRLIEQGLVTIDGKVAIIGLKVLPNVKIEINKTGKDILEEKVTFLLNKPIRYVSDITDKNYRLAKSLITPENQHSKSPSIKFSQEHLKDLAVAGRLDIESKGLIVFTQNGHIAKTIISPETKVEKEYIVRVEGKLSKEDLKLLNHGLSIDGKPLKPAKVEWLNEDQLRFILKEGKKRQIRKMCEQVGLKVTGLKRVRIGKIKLGKLKEGQWRYLEPHESFLEDNSKALLP